MFEKEDLKRFDERIIVFVLRFSKIDKYHVGYNTQPGKDLPALFNRLSKGIHRSLKLQTAYNDCEVMDHVYYSVVDVQTARLVKDSLVEYYAQQGRSLNKNSPDPTFKGMDLSAIVTEMKNNQDVWLCQREGSSYEKFVKLKEEHFEGLDGTSNLKLHMNGEIRSTNTFPAAYTIRHVTSDQFYVGSANNIYQRLIQHRHMIRKGYHENIKLNEAVKKSNEIEVCVYRSKDRTEAYAQEQQLLTKNWDKGILLNKSNDVENNLAGDVYRGIKIIGVRYRELVAHCQKNGERHRKQVSIKGRIYSSIRDAMRHLNMGRGPINDRIKSKKEEYSDWYYPD